MEKALNRINYIFEFQKKMGCSYVLEDEDVEAIKTLVNGYKEMVVKREYKETQKKEREYYKAHKICVQCRRNDAEKNITLCSECNAKKKEQNRFYYYKKKLNGGLKK